LKEHPQKATYKLKPWEDQKQKLHGVKISKNRVEITTKIHFNLQNTQKEREAALDQKMNDITTWSSNQNYWDCRQPNVPDSPKLSAYD